MWENGNPLVIDLEWLEYNIQRALGVCADEAERQMGVEQVVQTINRIKYLREKEDDIKMRGFQYWISE